jgi:perosamine synthetase
MVTVILDPRRGIDKTRLIALTSECGIDCRPIFTPLSALPAFAHHSGRDEARARNPVSYSLGPYGVNLPSALNLDRDTVVYVTDTLKAVLSESS